jgi:hypothetical protein
MSAEENKIASNIALAFGVLVASALLVYLVFSFVRFDWRWYANIGPWGRIFAAVAWLVIAGALRKTISVVGR